MVALLEAIIAGATAILARSLRADIGRRPSLARMTARDHPPPRTEPHDLPDSRADGTLVARPPRQRRPRRHAGAVENDDFIIVETPAHCAGDDIAELAADVARAHRARRDGVMKVADRLALAAVVRHRPPRRASAPARSQTSAHCRRPRRRRTFPRRRGERRETPCVTSYTSG